MGRRNRDIAKTCSRFLNALRRIEQGIEQQKQRLAAQANDAPKLLEGTDQPVTDLTGIPGNDLDYYAYELARLHDLAKSAQKIFDNADIATAIADFEKPCLVCEKCEIPSRTSTTTTSWTTSCG